MLSSPYPDRTRARNLAIAEVLLRREALRSWPILRPAMDSDEDFARQVLLQVASHFSFEKPFCRGMSEADIARLYVLMARLFPRNDEAERATGFISSWDSIGYLRDGIPRYLAGLGTEAAVSALSNLIAGQPQFAHLTYELSLAERAMRIATWSPLNPKEVLALADKPNLETDPTSPAGSLRGPNHSGLESIWALRCTEPRLPCATCGTGRKAKTSSDPSMKTPCQMSSRASCGPNWAAPASSPIAKSKSAARPARPSGTDILVNAVRRRPRAGPPPSGGTPRRLYRAPGGY